MKTLLHICCGPCATATVDHWRGEGHDLIGFFHNPNIQPLLEHRRRLQGARDLAEAVDLPLVEDPTYDPARWFAEVGLHGEGRCRRCIAHRLDRAAREAVAQGCEAVTTSLAISPWQDHEAIAEEGHLAGERHGMQFLYQDLRPLYRDSRRLARERGLYRQQYCGCILSEWERYRDA